MLIWRDRVRALGSVKLRPRLLFPLADPPPWQDTAKFVREEKEAIFRVVANRIGQEMHVSWAGIAYASESGVSLLWIRSTFAPFRYLFALGLGCPDVSFNSPWSEVVRETHLILVVVTTCMSSPPMSSRS